MKTNPIKELQKHGQSIWLDNLYRDLMTSGELKKLIEQGLTRLTSNPTIFEKAVTGSNDTELEVTLKSFESMMHQFLIVMITEVSQQSAFYDLSGKKVS